MLTLSTEKLLSNFNLHFSSSAKEDPHRLVKLSHNSYYFETQVWHKVMLLSHVATALKVVLKRFTWRGVVKRS